MPLLQHLLHEDYVEPAVELASYFALSSDLVEAACGVEGDRRFVATDDASDHGVKAVVARQLDEVAEQQPTDTAAAQVAPDVDRVLDRRRVGRPRPVRRQRCEAAHLAVIVD